METNNPQHATNPQASTGATAHSDWTVALAEEVNGMSMQEYDDWKVRKCNALEQHGGEEGGPHEYDKVRTTEQ